MLYQINVGSIRFENYNMLKVSNSVALHLYHSITLSNKGESGF